jgi:hexokinase
MFDKDKIDGILTQNGMHPNCIVMADEIDKYLISMRHGLNHPVKNSLLMLPTYVGVSDNLPLGQSAIAIDAGGTNLRVARVVFEASGHIAVQDLNSYPMPGSRCRVSKFGMFDEIAEKVRPLLTGDDKIGFCFSFVFQSTPDRDAIIEAMSKEVLVTDIGGAHACAELEAALLRQGATGTRRYAILNDTVAALLGGKAAHADQGFDSYVGMIFGTGFNACYIEQTRNIGKVQAGSYAADRMIVNMEAGVYNGLTQGAVDRHIDQISQRHGDHLYEKMVSGGYFGDVIYGTLKLLCEADIFSDACRDTLLRLGTVSLKTITVHIEGRGGEDNIYTRIAKANAMDGEILDYVLNLLYLRAAKMVLIMLSAIATQIGAGQNPAHPLCICAEGTTFYKSPLLTRHLETLQREFMEKERGVYLKYVHTDDATLVGTALAALTDS